MTEEEDREILIVVVKKVERRKPMNLIRREPTTPFTFFRPFESPLFREMEQMSERFNKLFKPFDLKEPLTVAGTGRYRRGFRLRGIVKHSVVNRSVLKHGVLKHGADSRESLEFALWSLPAAIKYASRWTCINVHANASRYAWK